MPVPAAFATQADMEARFDRAELVQLTDQANVDAIDSVRMAQALARASGDVLSHLSAKYDASADLGQTALDRLRDIACDLSRFYLHRDTAPDGVTKRFDIAMRALREIRDGTQKLDTGSHKLAARPEGVMVAVPERKFGRDSMVEY